MRNLKRALSLALAAAMLVSLMVVGASAASYGDEASISQNEAVEVLTGIGVVGGDQNGNFNPTATLTRAEFCVMIANALTGGSFDQTLFDGTDTPFTDVAGHWGAGYIAYCYSNGIVAGTSATTFEPDGTLTAAQAAAILLMALGYNQNNEFAANGQFSLNVTRWAQQAGLYDGLAVSANTGISRENTAKLIYNALVNTTPVGYSSLAEAYYTIGESALSGVVYSGKDLDPDDPTGVYGRTLGYTNFGLEYGVGSSDSFDRPAHRWISDNNTDIGTYADGAALTYTNKPSESALKSALNGYTIATGAEVSVDGNEKAIGTVGIAAGNVTDDNVKAIRDLMGNGKLVEIFANRANEITDVVVINSYLATVTSDYDEDEENVEIATGAGETYTLELDDFAGIVNYREDDKLVITVSEEGTSSATVRSVASATVVEDVEVTAYGSDNVTAAGTKYDYNAAADKTNDIVTNYDLSSTDTTYTLYLDTYGYVLGSEGYEAGANYVFISAYDYNDSAVNKGNPYTAKAYFTDGSTQVIDVKNEGAVESGWGTTNNDDVNTWYTYTKNSSDVYTLSAVDNDNFTDKAEVNSANALLATGVRANSSTVFIFLNDKGDVTSTVTGIRNVDFENADGYIVVKDGAAKAVVVTDYKGAKTAGDYIYILASTPATTNYDRTNEVDFYTYDAIVNGEKTTINSLLRTMTVGLYDAEYEYDGQYLSDTLTPITSNTGIEDEVVFVGALGTTDYSDGTLTLTATDAFVLADNYSLLTVDGKTVTSRTPARLVNLTNDDGDFAGVPAIVLLNEDGEATCVIVSAGIKSDASDSAEETKADVADVVDLTGGVSDWRGKQPVGDFDISGTDITVKYDSSNIADGLTNDLPRLLGEFYDQGVRTIVYDGVTYEWCADKGLAGSNWTVGGENTSNTLVKAISDDLKAEFGITDPTQAVKGATFSFNMTLDGVEFTYTGTYTGAAEE